MGKSARVENENAHNAITETEVECIQMTRRINSCLYSVLEHVSRLTL